MTDPDVLARLRASIQQIEADQTVAARPEPAQPDTKPDAKAEATADAKGDTGAGPDVAKAFRFLVRSTQQRPLTCREAAEKLSARGHEDDVVEQAVERAERARILDDEAFALVWVEDRGVKRGYGRGRLRRELRRRKVEEPVIDRALERLEGTDEREAATELARARAQRMPATVEPQRVAQRLVGFLVRRGYDSNLAHDVARTVTALDRGWD